MIPLLFSPLLTDAFPGSISSQVLDEAETCISLALLQPFSVYHSFSLLLQCFPFCSLITPELVQQLFLLLWCGSNLWLWPWVCFKPLCFFIIRVFGPVKILTHISPTLGSTGVAVSFCNFFEPSDQRQLRFLQINFFAVPQSIAGEHKGSAL